MEKEHKFTEQEKTEITGLIDQLNVILEKAQEDNHYTGMILLAHKSISTDEGLESDIFQHSNVSPMGIELLIGGIENAFTPEEGKADSCLKKAVSLALLKGLAKAEKQLKKSILIDILQSDD